MLLYGYVSWTLTKHLEKSKMGTTERCCMLFLTNPQNNTLQNSSCTATYFLSRKRERYARYCWKTKNELKSNVIIWTTTHDHTNVGKPAKTYIHQFSADTGCHLEDLPRAIADRDCLRGKYLRQYKHFFAYFINMTKTINQTMRYAEIIKFSQTVMVSNST